LTNNLGLDKNCIIRGGRLNNQHIYITYDEEIKDVRLHKGKWHLEKGNILNKFPNYLTDLSECKLVIMTTDQDLIKDGVQAIDDEFLEWFVKNPNCEEVKFDSICKCTSCDSSVKSSCDYTYKCNPQIFYKIIISKEKHKPKTIVENLQEYLKNNPKEKVLGDWNEFQHLDKEGVKEFLENQKQETLEEAAEKYSLELLEAKTIQPHEKTWIKSMFIHIAKWQQERMYSEEEIINALHSVELRDNKDYSKIYSGMKKCFEQYKKYGKN
jgi:type III secretion system FlhB-like substrate exporter